MAYIVACIEFDDNYNLKNVNIVDDENAVTDTNETLKTIIGKKNTFCIKISVNPCSSSDPECFMLSNDNYFKLDFDNFVPTANPILSDAFLNGSNANASSSNASSSNASSSNASSSNASSSNANASSSNASNVNASGSNPSNSFEEFKKRIIEELTKTLTKESDFDNFKKRIIEELTTALTKESDFDNFKKRIIQELTNALTPP